MTKFNQFCELIYLPLSWPTRMRRLFLLAVPVSLPLWVGLMFVVALIRVLQLVYNPIRIFWSAPPKPSRHNYFGYRFDPKRKDSQRGEIVAMGDKRAA